MNPDILYIALTLTQDSHDRLFGMTLDVLNELEDFRPKFLCHHSTLAFGQAITPEIEQWTYENEGNIVDISANGLGISDKAVAVACDYDAPCANAIKHITLAVNELTHGKPVDSNAIKEWCDIKPMQLRGKVTIYYKNKRK